MEPELERRFAQDDLDRPEPNNQSSDLNGKLQCRPRLALQVYLLC